MVNDFNGKWLKWLKLLASNLITSSVTQIGFKSLHFLVCNALPESTREFYSFGNLELIENIMGSFLVVFTSLKIFSFFILYY